MNINTAASEPERLLPRREVETRVGLKRSAIYDRMSRGSFPKPIHDDEGQTVWWLESEINAWIATKIARSRNVGRDVGSEQDA